MFSFLLSASDSNAFNCCYFIRSLLQLKKSWLQLQLQPQRQLNIVYIWIDQCAIIPHIYHTLLILFFLKKNKMNCCIGKSGNLFETPRNAQHDMTWLDLAMKIPYNRWKNEINTIQQNRKYRKTKTNIILHKWIYILFGVFIRTNGWRLIMSNAFSSFRLQTADRKKSTFCKLNCSENCGQKEDWSW